MTVAPLLAAIALTTAAAVAASQEGLTITTEAPSSESSFDNPSKQHGVRSFCAGRPIAITNGTSRGIDLDLYEEDSDVGFTVGRIAPGRTKEATFTTANRIVGLNHRTRRLLFRFVVVRCPTAPEGDAHSGQKLR